MNTPRTYIAIDLKSFYASVECVERGLDPLTTNLVVADVSRTDKTICLAVSPSLKKYGLSGRSRLFDGSPSPLRYRKTHRTADPLHHGSAAHGTIHAVFRPDLLDLSAVRQRR